MIKLLSPLSLALRDIVNVTALLVLFTVAANGSSAWAAESVRMFGTDYIDAREFGRSVGLSPVWVVAGEKLRLRNTTTEVVLTVHRTEVSLNGVSVFLTRPVVAARGSLYLAAKDATAVLEPVLAPRRNPTPRPVRTIVIDPGHGGGDPGKQNTKLRLQEKNLTLDVARRLEQLLKAKGFRVILTRRTDRTVGLSERATIAAKARADLFVSIHFNSFTDPGVSGAETFVMTPLHQPSSPAAERDRSMLKMRFPANAHDRWNAVLGYHVHRKVVDALDTSDRGLKRFRYHVLRSVNCPAVLVEAAFLSHPTEARNAGSAAFRNELAQALAAGIRSYASAVSNARTASLR